MKKKYAHNVLSDQRCVDCGKRLKKRLVEQKQARNITRCYRCGEYYERRQQTMKNLKTFNNSIKKHFFLEGVWDLKADRQNLIFWVIISAVSFIGMMLMALVLIDARNETRIIKSELFIEKMKGEARILSPEGLRESPGTIKKKDTG